MSENKSNKLLKEILKTPDPFSSNEIGTPRLIWDHSVHEYYMQACSYYLIRYLHPPEDLLSKVKADLDGQNITSYYIYVLYGHYDLLVRMWATATSRDQFQAHLRAEAEYHETVEFQAQSINYLFTDDTSDRRPLDHSKRLEHVKQNLGDINKVAGPEVSQLDVAAVTRLHSGGLLHIAGEREATGSDPFKFYLALKRIPGGQRNESQRLICNWVQEYNDRHAEKKVLHPAVYQGIGFADYLIKGLACSYEAIYQFNRHFVNRLAKDEFHQLRPETHIIATKKAVECDHLNPSATDQPLGVQRLSRLLGARDFAKKLERLEETKRHELSTLYEDYESELLNTPFERYLRPLLAARVLNDRDLLAEALAVLLRLEGLLVALLQRIWQQELGAQWVRVVNEAAQSVTTQNKSQNKTPQFDPNQVTLQQALAITGHLLKYEKLKHKNTFPKNAIEEVLWVPDWEKRVRAVGEYRNDLAHGRVFADPNYLENKWNELSKALLDVGEIFNKLHWFFNPEPSSESPDADDNRE